MPEPGIEPGWGYPQGILSPSRLPISPLRRNEPARRAEDRAEPASVSTTSQGGRGLAPPCTLRPQAGPSRAGNGTRTRDPNLGKVVLYQLSYSRVPAEYSGRPEPQTGRLTCRPRHADR